MLSRPSPARRTVPLSPGTTVYWSPPCSPLKTARWPSACRSAAVRLPATHAALSSKVSTARGRPRVCCSQRTQVSAATTDPASQDGRQGDAGDGCPHHLASLENHGARRDDQEGSRRLGGRGHLVNRIFFLAFRTRPVKTAILLAPSSASCHGSQAAEAGRHLNHDAGLPIMERRFCRLFCPDASRCMKAA